MQRIEKKKAIVCDIDGCLLDVSYLYRKIFNLGLKGDDKWKFFHENANNPLYAIKVPHIFNLLNMYLANDYALILLTSRRDIIGKDTLSYLLNGDVKLDNINMMVMRDYFQEGMPSHLFKKAEIKKLQELYDIQLVIDDEFKNCGMFRELGYTVLRVLRKESISVN